MTTSIKKLLIHFFRPSDRPEIEVCIDKLGKHDLFTHKHYMVQVIG